MANWKNALIRPDATLHDAIAMLDSSALQVVMVVDESEHLKGTITDGDIRRAILSGKALTESVEGVMKTTPITVGTETTRHELIRLMKTTTVRRLPVLDADGHIVGLELLEQLIDVGARGNAVVLMAGGLGSRLMPRTERTPKPMLEIGGKPMLERTIDGFKAHGFHKFILAVNYRAEVIQRHFGDGSHLGVEIQYVHEADRLGTAGALSLIEESLDRPFFVMNGDVLTDCNFEMMLDFHSVEKSTVTMAVREYDFQVPFGVVSVDQPRILSIDEKPVHSFFVNAGIYTLEPSVLKYLERGEYADMPAVIGSVIDDGGQANAFPLREAWLDVGSDEDFQRAQARYRAESE
jgi:dTDP-glucose pyrophosphorylase/predicted transcriptional regulator